MTLTEAVGKRLAALLEKQGWSQYQLQKRGGVPRSTVCVILSGKYKTVELNTIYQIATTLGISLQEFFNDPIFDEVTD